MTDAILNVISTVLSALLNALPTIAVPSWLTSVGTAVATVSSNLSSSSAFVPWSYLFLGIGVVLAAYGISTAIRGVRIAASFLTLGGGS